MEKLVQIPDYLLKIPKTGRKQVTWPSFHH